MILIRSIDVIYIIISTSNISIYSVWYKTIPLDHDNNQCLHWFPLLYNLSLLMYRITCWFKYISIFSTNIPHDIYFKIDVLTVFFLSEYFIDSFIRMLVFKLDFCKMLLNCKINYLLKLWSGFFPVFSTSTNLKHSI